MSPVAAAPPLYITIGPPCAGKTTWIRRQQSSTIIDVSIDDQAGVYVPLPRHYFLSPAKGENISTATCLHQKTILQRLEEETEISCVLARLEGSITAAECRSTLLQQSTDKETANALADVVEEFTEENQDEDELPETVDLFIREALFQPNSVDNTSAIQKANRCLQQTPPTSSVSWGNTNTKATDYQEALRWAESTRRPVHFVVYMEPDAFETMLGNHNETLRKDIFQLQSNGFSDLLRRSMRRFLSTGRYVPAFAILMMRRRSLELVSQAVDTWKRESRGETMLNRLQLDQILAKMIQFDMRPDRTVVARKRPREYEHSRGGGPRQGQRGGEYNNSRYPRYNDHARDVGGEYHRPSQYGGWRPREDHRPGQTQGRGRGRYY